jgi:class 3 adenylate cyclase
VADVEIPDVKDARSGDVASAYQIAALADAGEVLVSQTVKDLVEGSEIEFGDRGVHELKGVPGEWKLYAVHS